MNTITRTPRKALVGLGLGLALLAVPATVGTVPTASAATASTCRTAWGSLPEQAGGHTTEQLTDVRSGRHTCFDRLVVDLDGAGSLRPGYRVEYVDQVTADGSGAVVPLRGGAAIQIIVRAPASTEEGEPTYTPVDPAELVDVAGYRTFRQAAWAGSFEGQTTLGLGVRARLPMRVFTLDGPGTGHRLVVDVAHRW